MIELKTKCEDCIHKKVCKNIGNTRYAMEKLKNMIYSNQINIDYSWEVIMKNENIHISFSCDDFIKYTVVRKGGTI